MNEPTPFSEVNTTLRELLAAVQNVLGAQFVGMYLYGSLASGDFTLATSDIDFLVVTRDVLPEAPYAALADMHERLAASGGKWASKLEGSYLAQAALARYDPAGTTAWPTLNEGAFFRAPHGWDWVLQRHILREGGVTVAGPPIAPMIAPVAPDELRRAVAALLRSWWAALPSGPQLARDDYQAFAILSMCRALHTFKHGTIASKPVAARWAQAALGEPYATAITQALAWQPGQMLGARATAITMIELALARARQIDA